MLPDLYQRSLDAVSQLNDLLGPTGVAYHIDGDATRCVVTVDPASAQLFYREIRKISLRNGVFIALHPPA